jgi:hypothetical protein
MAKFRAKPGYRRVPGKARRYVELSTGKEISRRQYIKKTEGVRSLEAKAKQRREQRISTGQIQPMRSYDSLVKRYKEKNGKNARVRGNSKEAKEFRKNVRLLKNAKRDSFNHIKAAYELGLISEEQAKSSAQRLGIDYESIIGEDYDE